MVDAQCAGKPERPIPRLQPVWNGDAHASGERLRSGKARLQGSTCNSTAIAPLPEAALFGRTSSGLSVIL